MAEKYAEALVEYKKALVEFPDSTGLWWNAGTAAFFTKDYPLALSLWSKLKKAVPEDDAVRAKLIQLYRASGDMKALRAEREQLVVLRKSKKNATLSAKPSFCCDQFTVVGKKVFAYDFFELSGDRALRYNFLVLKPDGTTDYRISVGSYKDTNDISRELGQIKANQRLFHLDGYYDQGHTHKTFKFYLSEPAYDTAKKDVIAVLEGKVKMLSGSTNQK